MEISTYFPSVCFQISTLDQIGEARRYALSLAKKSDLTETEEGKTGIIVTELATNLIKHGGGGKLIFRQLPNGIEILSLDQGLGMFNVNECLKDGFSTGRSPGNGLGAVKRLSETFEIYSLVQKGTVILSQVIRKSVGAPSFFQPSNFLFGAVSIPIFGEEVCGDNWAWEQNSQFATLMVADGLGHGPMAFRASELASQSFEKTSDRSTTEIIQKAHLVMKHSRGAALAVARVDLERKLIYFSGIGNISGIVVSGGRQQQMVSHNGIVGSQIRKIQEFTYPISSPCIFLMHSDGISTHWNFNQYPGLANYHPSIIAGVIYRDCVRTRDDSTLIALKPRLQ